MIKRFLNSFFTSSLYGVGSQVPIVVVMKIFMEIM